jgi:hypothetical protein
MTATEQEDLFKMLKAAHPTWHPRLTSGYVAGAAAAEAGDKMHKQPFDEYGHGFILGFAIHSGADVELESWFGRL